MLREKIAVEETLRATRRRSEFFQAECAARGQSLRDQEQVIQDLKLKLTRAEMAAGRCAEEAGVLPYLQRAAALEGEIRQLKERCETVEAEKKRLEEMLGITEEALALKEERFWETDGAKDVRERKKLARESAFRAVVALRHECDAYEAMWRQEAERAGKAATELEAARDEIQRLQDSAADREAVMERLLRKEDVRAEETTHQAKKEASSGQVQPQAVKAAPPAARKQSANPTDSRPELQRKLEETLRNNAELRAESDVKAAQAARAELEQKLIQEEATRAAAEYQKQIETLQKEHRLALLEKQQEIDLLQSQKEKLALTITTLGTRIVQK